MLKAIHPLLTGDPLATLADMGHGDEIAAVDASVPAAALARRLVRLPATSATDALEAILTLLPLDDFVEAPAAAMDAPDGCPTICDESDRLTAAAEGPPARPERIDRFGFCDRAWAAFAVVATGERRLYANVILKKGVMRSHAGQP